MLYLAYIYIYMKEGAIIYLVKVGNFLYQNLKNHGNLEDFLKPQKISYKLYIKTP